MLSLSNRNRKFSALALVLSLFLTLVLIPAQQIDAADHGDSPNNANDRAADLGDTYVFLDPTDNTKLFLAMTVQGFITPGEAVNFSLFDHNVRFRFELETTGDAAVDNFIDVSFSEKMTSAATPQVGTISSTFFPTFTGPSTVANLSPTAAAATITTDPATGISFYAGVVDDPFFFDIPAFGRFNASVVAGTPDATQLQRGRDTFAGYNTLAIALSIPVARVRALLGSNNTIGVNSRTFRRVSSVVRRPTRGSSSQSYVIVDRAGLPAVNVALIPYSRKNEFNLASTEDDAAGRFAGDIVASLRRFGTNDANIGLLAQVAVAKGDFLRLDLTRANSGPGGGNNAGTGFPNGRRLADDVIDTILTIIANNAPLGDNVNANDVTFRDSFPFFGVAQQPRNPGTVDDNTRN